MITRSPTGAASRIVAGSMTASAGQDPFGTAETCLPPMTIAPSASV